LALPSIKLENFELLEAIGKGGLGSVFLAQQQDPERQVAIRIISPEAGLPADLLEAMSEEGRIATSFHHPSLISVYECGIVDEHFYLAMEYLPGGDLESRLDGPMDQDVAAQTVKAIGDALGYLHTHDFLHRDLKPGQILFNQKDRPVLADFGTASASDTQASLTRLGYATGTPAYMSPEQILGESLDGRSDLYSLGTVFFRMLTGNLPFEQESTQELKQAKVSELPPRLPKHLRHYQIVLDRLLDRDVEDRFADSDKLQVALDFRLQSTGEFPAPKVDEAPEPVLETTRTLKYRISNLPPEFWLALAGTAIVLSLILWWL
jgi:serine/threonine-protein kinase PpkA